MDISVERNRRTRASSIWLRASIIGLGPSHEAFQSVHTGQFTAQYWRSPSRFFPQRNDNTSPLKVKDFYLSKVRVSAPNYGEQKGPRLLEFSKFNRREHQFRNSSTTGKPSVYYPTTATNYMLGDIVLSLALNRRYSASIKQYSGSAS